MSMMTGRSRLYAVEVFRLNEMPCVGIVLGSRRTGTGGLCIVSGVDQKASRKPEKLL